ncbi:MAG: D-alanine--D-alanine ligase [Armatimonadia bacterium]
MDMAQLRSKTIAVLAGGQSGEREVSLRSGKGVQEALERQGFRTVMVDPSADLYRQLQEVGADVAVNALHGGAGEDGTIQALLELIGMPYTGSGVLASALTMNKLQTKRIAAAIGVQNPPFVYFTGAFDPDWVCQTIDCIGLPAVTKPNAEGSSLGVTICRDEATLAREMEAIAAKYDDVLVDRFIDGTELTVGVLGCGEAARALPVLQLVPKKEFYDYEAKYTKGLTELVCPAQISPEATAAAQELALLTHREMGCHGVSRCDMHLDRAGNLWFHEVNSCPGMTETSDVPHQAFAAGMTYDELVLEILQSAIMPRR